jgi:hypothetical protein
MRVSGARAFAEAETTEHDREAHDLDRGKRRRRDCRCSLRSHGCASVVERSAVNHDRPSCRGEHRSGDGRADARTIRSADPRRDGCADLSADGCADHHRHVNYDRDADVEREASDLDDADHDTHNLSERCWNA